VRTLNRLEAECFRPTLRASVQPGLSVLLERHTPSVVDKDLPVIQQDEDLGADIPF
jgi:hypothetical protein